MGKGTRLTEKQAQIKDTIAGWVRKSSYTRSQDLHLYECPLCLMDIYIRPNEIWDRGQKSCKKCFYKNNEYIFNQDYFLYLCKLVAENN